MVLARVPTRELIWLPVDIDQPILDPTHDRSAPEELPHSLENSLGRVS